MTLTALRDDALGSTPGGFTLRLSLPWIRSLPLSSLVDLAVEVDAEARPVTVRLAHGDVAPADLAAETGWWFVQDRVVLHAEGAASPGAHDVSVSFHLLVPYLQAGPDGPLRLPFTVTRTLHTDARAAAPHVSCDVA